MDNSPTNPTGNSTEDSVSSVYRPGATPAMANTGLAAQSPASPSLDTHEPKRSRWPLFLLLLILLSLATGYALMRIYDARLDKQANDLAGLQQDANLTNATINQLTVNDLTAQTGEFVTIDVTELATIHDLEVTGTSNLGGDTSVTGNLSVTGQTSLESNLAVAGDGRFGGSVYATNFYGSFSGDGSGATGVDADTLQGQPKSFYTNASNLSSGTLSDGRLSSNVALLNADQTFSGTNTFTANNRFSGNNNFLGDNSFSGDNNHSGNNTFSGDNEFSGDNSFTGTNTFQAVNLQGHLIGTTAAFSGNVSGADAVNTDEFVTLGQLTDVSAGNFFLQGGNSFGETAILGTNDTHDLAFETDGTEKMRILVNGNVGIGAAAPSSRLTIDMAGANGGIKLQNATQTRIDFETTFAGSANFNMINEGNQNRFAIRETGGNNIFWIQGGAPANSLTVVSTGNVGVGTASPSERLHVTGNINIDNNNAYLIGGHHALSILDGNSTKDITRVGYLAGSGTDPLQVTRSTVVGSLAGQNATGANQSTFGYLAGYGNTGTNQSTFGYLAGRDNTGVNQSAFGYLAGRNNTGTNQSAFGFSAGRDNTGNRLSAFGHEAGYGNQGHNVVAIGYQAGLNNTLSNQFIVQQASVSATPLIQGDFSTGNVGIGTTAPSYKLDVSGGTGIVAQFSGRVIGGQAVNSNEFITLGQLNTTADATYFKQGGNSFGSTAILGTNDNFDLNLRTNGTAKLTVQAGGNVGIGTTAPDARLQVNTGVAGAIGQIIQGAALQTADLLQLQNSAGTTLVSISAAGSYAATGADPSAVTFRVRGASGQTNSIARFESPGGVSPFRIAADGNPEADALFVKTLSGSTSRVGGLLTINSLSSITFNNSTNRLVQNDPVAHSLGIYGAASNGTGAARILEIGNTVQVNPRLATTVGLVVKGLAGQSADLLQAQDSTGAVLASISASGDLTVKNTTVQGTLTVSGDATFNGNVISFSNNVRGINQAITSASTTLAVTFGTAYPDANYAVNCTPNYDSTCFVTGKSTTGFTLNFGTAAPAGATVDWFVAH